MATSQLLGLESYVTGPQPESVSIHAEPLSWVVSVHNKRIRTTIVGYFGNPRESEGFEAMPLPISSDGELSGLEVRLICVAPQKEGNATVLEKMGVEVELDPQYLVAKYEIIGVPTKSIKVRYVRGSKLVNVNMARGTLNMKNWPGDEWRPPEPDENESYDPPEPGEERFLHSRQR